MIFADLLAAIFSSRLLMGIEETLRDPRIFTWNRTQFSRTEGRPFLPCGAVFLAHRVSLSTYFFVASYVFVRLIFK